MSKNIYRTFTREKKLEDELKEIEEANQPKPEGAEEEEQELTPEEKTFKKRYSDLRSFSQKKENELNERIQRLETQLSESTKKQIKFPKTKEEVEEWMSKYPDVAGIVRSIAMEEVRTAREELDSKFKMFEEEKKRAKMDSAYKRLLGYHPDFEEIRESEEFQEWIQTQPHWIYASLYENETDAEAAARAIDLYKLDAEKKNKKSKKNDTPDQARSVKTPPGTSPEVSDGLKFTESMVKKMSQRDYERFSAEIDEAMKDPRFYDRSGGAR